MISQNNVGIAKRALKAVWNGGRGAAQKTLFADNFVFRNLSSLEDVTDLDGLRQRAASVRSTYPCGRLKVQDSVGFGEVISVWWTFRDDEGCRSGRSRVHSNANCWTARAWSACMQAVSLKCGSWVASW